MTAMAKIAKLTLLITSTLLFVTIIEGGKRKTVETEDKLLGFRSSGKEKSGQPGEMAQCMGKDLKLEPLNSAAEECKKEMKISDEQGEKNPCFIACTWKKLGLVGKDMMFTKDVSSFVSSVFPKEAQQSVSEAMLRCEKASPGALSMDNNCKDYKPLKKCIIKAVMSVCKS